MDKPAPLIMALLRAFIKKFLLFFFIISIFNLYGECYTLFVFPANNLEKYFEELNNQSWTLIPIDSTMASKLQKSAEFKYTSKLFKPAKVSHSNDLSPEIRNDCSFWLDTKSDNLLAVDLKALANFELLTTALKNYFRISLTEIECHFSVYQAGGFYKKHQDTTAANNK